jgi:hypothetical protein
MKNTICCFVLFTSFLVGCLEEETLYIDKSCNMDEIHTIFRAVDKINEVLGYEEVAVVGSKKIDYVIEANETNGVSVFMCISSISDGAHFPKFDVSVGRNWRDDIYVRSDITTYGDYGIRGFESVAMHELMHFIGVSSDEHTDDPNDVISKYFNPSTMPIEYSDTDKELIKKYSRR